MAARAAARRADLASVGGRPSNAGAALGWWVHPAWFLFTAFVGANLLQSSFTSFCPLERILARFGAHGADRVCDTQEMPDGPSAKP